MKTTTTIKTGTSKFSARSLLLLLMISLSGCLGQDNGSDTTTAANPIQPSDNDNFQVNAGPDFATDEAQIVSLSAEIQKGSDRTIRSINWSQSESDTFRAQFLTETDQSKIEVQLPQVPQTTPLQFIVVVENDLGERVRGSVTITVQNRLSNQLPTAIIEKPLEVPSTERQVRLSGCRSSDPDGSINTYIWKRIKPNGPITIDQNRCEIDAALDAAARTSTLYVFELTVVDNQNATSAPVSVQVTQAGNNNNAPPTIDAVSIEPEPVYVDDEVTLTASATDPESNVIRYSWTQIQGDDVKPKGQNTGKIQFVAPKTAQELKFRLTATDSPSESNQSDTRIVTVSVQARPQYTQASPQICLQNPASPGCGAALQFLIPSNPVADALGLSVKANSAGSCNPEGRPNWLHYWGALHEHTAYSDGTALTKPADVFRRVASKGLDFAFSTDHSDNMGLPVPVTLADDPEFCSTNPQACVLSDPAEPASNFSKWQSTAAQAGASTSNTFTAMRGFEWTSDRFGHANVLLSTHYINPKTGPGYLLSMDAFWAWFLTSVGLGGGQDGLMIFNHPGREDALHGVLTQTPIGSDPAYTFNDLAYIPAADYRVVGLEVFGKGDEYDSEGKKGSWLAYGLDKGWYLGAAGSEDHHGTQWGESNLPKTVLIARSRHTQDLREALLARRFYAVAQSYNDIKLDLIVTDSKRSYLMGSRISTTDKQVSMELHLSNRPQRQAPIAPQNIKFEILSSQADNSKSYNVYKSGSGAKVKLDLPVREKNDWFFVRVRDMTNNKIIAVSSPVWIKAGTNPLPACNPAL